MLDQAPLLVVDDDADIRRLISDALSDRYAVETVESGPDALHALETQAFVVVVVDLGIPGMSGAELIEKIRSLSNYDSIAIVVCSAAHEPGLLVERLDVQAVLPKPFTLDRLEDTVSLAVLSRRNQEASRTLGVSAQAIIRSAQETSAEAERLRREAQRMRLSRRSKPPGGKTD